MTSADSSMPGGARALLDQLEARLVTLDPGGDGAVPPEDLAPWIPGAEEPPD